MRTKEILAQLERLGNPKNVAGMARFGINPHQTLGVSIPNLRKMAKQIGSDHALALELWASGIHEARILASMIDAPVCVTPAQMEAWVKDFDSWDVCDQVCMNLFEKTKHAYHLAIAWSKREEEFVKRAGFALMACLAWHDKKARDGAFIKFMPAIKRGATDERNFVRKAVNWALRNIGKRNRALNQAAIQTAREIQHLDSKAARWIASDALRELTNAKIQKRLRSE
jgi:3-methyladenine DNA glycosylase AlkD